MDQFAFSHKHYVPIMKTKAGERWALSHLDATSRAHLTPLLELHKPSKPRKANPKKPPKKPRTPRPPKDLATHANEVCESLSADWGTDAPFFLDPIWVQGSTGTPEPISVAFAAARTHDLLAIPVARVDYGAAQLAQIRAIINTDNRGCMLRVFPEQLEHRQIDAVLVSMGLKPAQVHFLLDYQNSQMDLAKHVAEVPHLKKWLTFAAASGCFPPSLAKYKKDTWHSKGREDWTSWNAVASKPDLARRPSFGDFTVRDPGPPPDFGAASVNMRYACDTAWLVRIGGLVRDGASRDMKTVCHELIDRSEYCGPSFSAGDHEIFQTAQPGTSPGGAVQWVQWCVNHHLVFTAAQIRQHRAP